MVVSNLIVRIVSGETNLDILQDGNHKHIILGVPPPYQDAWVRVARSIRWPENAHQAIAEYHVNILPRRTLASLVVLLPIHLLRRHVGVSRPLGLLYVQQGG